MSRRRILVVDDEPGMLRAVSRVLERAYDVRCTETPEEAQSIVADFAPHLALLDIRMPGTDGFVLMDRLREQRPGLDVILMTGSVGETDRKLVRAIRNKAFYFIHKPFDRSVLLTLIERCFEIRELEEAAARHTRWLEGVLAEARAFQQGMVPPVDARFGRIAVAARLVSCDDLCGDLYDYAGCDDGSVAFIVADVSGHGASAAMLTGIVKSAFQSCFREGYRPQGVAERISAGIRTFGSNRFVTAFCGRIDVERGTLEYVNAGHPPGLLRAGSGKIVPLAPTGPLISPVFDRACWTAETCRFEAGASLVAYTDGLTEAPGPDGFFGDRRLARSVKEAPPGGRALLDAVVADVEAFMQGRRAVDDLTLLNVRSD